MLKNFVPYNETHQTRTQAPDAYENLLGDVLEAAFGQGITDLDGVVQFLKDHAVPPPGEPSWTPRLLESELARLGA